MHPDDTRPVQVSTTHGVIDACTPLFLLTLKVPALPVRDRVYPNAWLALLRTGDPPQLYDFVSLIGDYTHDRKHDYAELFLVQDCFTAEQMELIRSYFECHRWPGATFVIDPVSLRVSSSYR